MSIGSIGGAGYPDDQRVENWDGPILYRADGASHVGNRFSPAFDTSRYAALGGFMSESQNPSNVDFFWYQDQGLSIPSGHRGIGLGPNMSSPAAMFLPSMGPWCQVEFSGSSLVTPYTQGVTLFATNRIVATPVLGPSMDLAALNGINILAGATHVLGGGNYFQGPARLFTSATQPGCVWQFHFYDVSGTLRMFDSGAIPTVPTPSIPVVLPWRAYEIHVVNTGAATSEVFLYLTGTGTGGL